MNKKKSLLIRLLAFLPLVGFAQQSTPIFKDGIRQGRVLVKFKDDGAVLQNVERARSKARTAGEPVTFDAMPALSNVARKVSAKQMTPLFIASPRFRERFEREGLDRWYILEYSSSDSPLSLMHEMRQISEVELCEPDYQLAEPTFTVREVSDLPQTIDGDMPMVNDPLYSKQWHYNNTGQTGGLPGADINLEKAWRKRMNAKNVIVAIMDQGVDATHEDLNANMWVNEKELAGLPGVDDDGNGYIDDVYGFDFANGYGNVAAGEHGTHVAGTVAAVTNNRTGVAGVAGGDGFGNGARLMTMPVFGSNPERAANSYIYAADNGAVISQNSWGYSTPGIRSEAYEEAIRYFVKYAGCDNNGNQLPESPMKGGIVIFAAGNTGTSGDYYPSCLEEVVAVGALNHRKEPSFYTTYDNWVDVASYGGETATKNEQGVLSTLPGNKYGFMQGTSMACPHVSGIAALAVAELGGPGFTEAMLKNYLILTSHNNEATYSGTYKGKMGKGIVDALLSITRNDGTAPKTIEDANIATVSTNYARLTFTAPSKIDGSRIEGYKIQLTGEGVAAINLTISQAKEPGQAEDILLEKLTPGVAYQMTVRSYDLWGVESLPSQAITFTTSTVAGNFTYTKPLTTTTSRSFDYDQQKFWEFDIEVTNNSKDANAGAIFWRADGYSYRHLDRILGVNRSSAKEGELISVPLAAMPQPLAAGDGSVYDVAGFEDWLSYRPAFYPDKYIGELKENGALRACAAAVKFVVPESMKEGFTLSHFDVAIRTSRYWLFDEELENPTNLKLYFEIYRGGDVPKLENCVFTGIFNDPEDQLIRLFALPIRPHFEPGEHFWIVARPDKRYQYPLGVNGDGLKPENSLYSADGGSTWTPLNKAYTGVSNPVFTMAALSDGKSTGVDISLSPSSGYLSPNQKQTVKARVNFENMKEGVDSTVFYFNTDGSITRKQLIAITQLTRKDVDVYFGRESYDYGMTSIGSSDSLKVMIYNKGMAHMPVEKIELTNTTDFKLLTTTYPAFIAAGDSMPVSVLFNPSGLGAKNTQIVISGRGVSKNAYLVGTCVEAPSVLFNPTKIDITVLGEEKSNFTLELKNTSNYALNYEIPGMGNQNTDAKRSSAYQQKPSAERTDTLDCSAGYRWVDSNMKKGYQGSPWREISQTGIELTPYCDDLKKFAKVKLPFSFRYYDRVLKEIYVGINGMLRCDNSDFSLSVPVEFPYESDDAQVDEAMRGVIAPLWLMDGTSGHFNATRFYYQVFEDCILFQFTGTKVWMMQGTDNSTNMQIALYPDGSFEIRYKKMFGDGGMLANAFSIGWSSPDGKDGKTLFFRSKQIVYECAEGDYCIKVIPPVYNPFVALENEIYQGTIGPMATKSVRIGVLPKELPGGVSERTLLIRTNDPLHAAEQLPVVIRKEDHVSVNFVDSLADFGKLTFAAPSYTRQIALFNNSTSNGKVRLVLSGTDNATFSNGATEIEPELKSNSLAYIPITFTGTVDANLYAYDPNVGTLMDSMRVVVESDSYFNIHADILDKKAFSYDFKSGESKSEVVKVTSSNATAYRSQLFTPGFMRVAQKQQRTSQTTEANIDMGGYRWYSSQEAGAPQFIWSDISKTGTRLDLSPDLEYNGHDLPFSFPFYGKEYTHLYVAPSGRISPFPLGWDVMSDFFPPRRLPDTGIANPMIAGMWTRQWYMDTDPEAGIYYQITEDRMVVQYHRFMYDWVTTFGYCSYQIILHKDGTIQFVYNDIEQSDLREQVTIAMQGKANSQEQGYTYTLNSSTPIKNHTTITAKPMYGPYTVEAGESIDLEFTADSYGFKAGTYSDSILFITENGQLRNAVPVNMTVSSSATLMIREKEINFGEVIAGNEVAPLGVNLVNSGNEDLEIVRLAITGEDASLFSIKKQLVVVDSEGVMSKEYVDVTAPITLTAYGNESYEIFVSPIAQTKACEALLEVETEKHNAASVPLKIYSLIPPRIRVTTPQGDRSLDVAIGATTENVLREFKVTHEEGVVPVDFAMNYKVVNPRVEEKSSLKRAASSSLSRIQYFIPGDPFFMAHTALDDEDVLSMKPTSIASDQMEPFGSISVIGNKTPTALMGAGSLGSQYGLSCFVKMNTGDHGFLMSHVRYLTNTLGRDTAEVTLRIYDECKEPSREHLIYEKKHLLKMATPQVDELYLPLERSLVFAPNQEFWVEIYFTYKMTMPMAVASSDAEEEKNPRNFYKTYNALTDTWTELEPYNAYFCIWAVQESYSDLARWLTVGSELSNINPAESVNGKMTFNRLHLPVGEVSLDLGMTTEQRSEVECLRVNVSKYREPRWTLLPEKPMLVTEGEEISFKVRAEDSERLPIAYRLTSPVDGVTLTKLSNDTLLVHYKAPFTAGSVSNLNIEARTSEGVSIRRVSIANVNVNRAPIALSVKPVTLSLGAMNPLVLPVSFFFVDPDNDAMEFRINTSTEGVTATLERRGIVITPSYEDIVDVTITAFDGYAETTNKMRVTVVQPLNTPPVLAVPISNRVVEKEAGFSIELNDYFYDVEGDSITFEAWATNPDVATAVASEGLLSVATHQTGYSAIAIKARDAKNGETLVSFTIRVDEPAEASSSEKLIFLISPNPVIDQATLRFTTSDPDQDTQCVVCDLNGRQISTTSLKKCAPDQMTGTVEVQALKEGVYLLQVVRGSEILSIERMIVKK